MPGHINAVQPYSADERLPPATPHITETFLHEIQAVNAQLLIAGLREQTLAEQLGRQAEQLSRQLAFTTAITSSLVEGVYVVDTAGRCTFVNPAAEQMLGWTSAELHGQDVSAVIPIYAARGASRAAAPAPLMDVLRFGTTQRNADAVFGHRDGGRFPTAYSAAPILMDGQVVGAVITFRDMTNVRRLQRKRDEYLALIAHDLRAPLTAILGRAQLLVRWLTQHGLAREAASATIVVESSIRMNEMIDDVLDRSRTDAAMEAQNRSGIDLVALVRQMIEQTIAPDDHARVTLDAVPTLPVVVDVEQIERVIVNVLTNALKFSPRDTPIVVHVSQQATDAMIAVTDQGIGIAAEDIPQLFEKHYRTQTTEQIAGNGLGLYGSQLIVEAHGGRLWAESTVGVGSTFTLTLPLPA
jgi:PAS domain S-box-containing protein